MEKTKFKTLMAMLVLLTFAIKAPAQQPIESGYLIKGQLTEAPDGMVIYLRQAGNKKILDSAVVNKEKFQFSGKVACPSLHTLTFMKNKREEKGRPSYQPDISLFVENTEIMLNGNLNDLPTGYPEAMRNKYYYKDITINGSAAHDKYDSFRNDVQPLNDKRSDLFMDEYIAYLNPGQGKEKGSISEGIAIVSRIDEAAAQRDAFIKSFVKNNNDNLIGLQVAKENLGKFSVKEIEVFLNGFKKEVKESAAWPAFVSHAHDVKKTAEGAMYTDFSFNDHKGNPVKLSDHVAKGKYVLLEFWASWCGPCRADIPHLKEVYELYHPEGFEVISISMDDDKEKWLKAIEDEKMKWLQVSDLKAFSGELSKIYNFRGIPTCILLDPQGRIVTRNMRGSWMDKELMALYGNKFTSAK